MNRTLNRGYAFKGLLAVYKVEISDLERRPIVLSMDQ